MICLAPAARDWLNRTTTARVLHVFDQVCNLVNERGQVLALVTDQAGPGPFAVVIPSRDLVSSEKPGLSGWADADSAVAIQDHILRVGRLAVNTAGAAIWWPRPAWEWLHGGRLSPYLAVIASALQDGAAAGSLAALAGSAAVTAVPGAVGPAVQEKAAGPAAALWRGLAGGRLALVGAGAAGLAGLGGGLTPAGDDFLIGAVYALWSTWPGQKARRFADAILHSATPRTNHLSAAWLAAAARAEAAPAWHQLVEALAGEEEDQLAVTLQRILNTGHTSGADALAGFLTTAKAVGLTGEYPV